MYIQIKLLRYILIGRAQDRGLLWVQLYLGPEYQRGPRVKGEPGSHLGAQEISRHDYLIKWHRGSAIFGHTNIYEKSLYDFYDNTEYFETT